MGWLLLPGNSGNGNNSSVFPVRLFQGYPLFGLPCVDSKVKQVSFLDELQWYYGGCTISIYYDVLVGAPQSALYLHHFRGRATFSSDI